LPLQLTSANSDRFTSLRDHIMGVKDSKLAQSNQNSASSSPSSLSLSPPADEAPAATEYELSYFGGITTDEGAPSTAYWGDVFRRLELAGCQADFPLIEKLVFHHLLLRTAVSKLNAFACSLQSTRRRGALPSPTPHRSASVGLLLNPASKRGAHCTKIKRAARLRSAGPRCAASLCGRGGVIGKPKPHRKPPSSGCLILPPPPLGVLFLAIQGPGKCPICKAPCITRGWVRELATALRHAHALSPI
jgi:hypothetical protein